MGILYPGDPPGSAFDTFTTPSSPESTPLSEAGTGTRNLVESVQDQGTAIETLEQNAALLTHDHSGNGTSVATGAKLLQANTHQSVDTDVAVTSIHHTIGNGPTQAAPGNHVHDYNGSTIINKPYIVCTSTTRPVNPEVGTIIWETDTNRSRVWSSFPNNVLTPGTSFTDTFNRTSAVAAFDACVGTSAGGANAIQVTLGLSTSATALVVGVTNYSSSAPYLSGWNITVTCGSTPMVRLGIEDNAVNLTGFTVLYGLINPPTGTQTISCTMTNSSYTADLVMAAASYTNVGAFGPVVSNQGDLGFPFPVTTESSPGDIVVGVFGGGQGALSGPSGTSRYYNYPGSPYVALMLQDTMGSYGSTTTLSVGSSALTTSSVGVNLIVGSSNVGTNYAQSYVTGTAANGTMSVPVSGTASWIVGTNAPARVIARCTAANISTTVSDNQDITFTTGTTMGLAFGYQSPTDDVYLRMSSNEQSYVRLCLTNAQALIYYTNSGPSGEALLGSSYVGTLSAGLQWEIKVSGRIFTLYRAGVQMLVVTDQTNATALGASNRGWGIGMSAAAGQSNQIVPATIVNLSVNDLPIYSSEVIWQLTTLGSVPYVRAETHVGQEIAVTNQVATFWDTLIEDIFGFFGFNQVGSQTTITPTVGVTITEAGHYDAHASVPWDPAYSGFDHAMIGFTVNGQDIGRRNWSFMRGNGYAPGFSQTNDIYMHWHFAAGDVLRVVVAHNASSPMWLFYQPSSPNIQTATLDLKFTGP